MSRAKLRPNSACGIMVREHGKARVGAPLTNRIRKEIDKTIEGSRMQNRENSKSITEPTKQDWDGHKSDRDF
jgi:hypothetical protein